MDEELYMEDLHFQASMYHNLRQHPTSWVETNPEKLLEMILKDEDEWQPVKNQHQHHHDYQQQQHYRHHRQEHQQQQHGKSNFQLDDDGWMDDLMESLPTELDDASAVDPGFSTKRSKSLGDMETNSNIDDDNSNDKWNNNSYNNYNTNNNNIVGCSSPDNEKCCLSDLDVTGNRFTKDSEEFNADLIANQNRNDSEAIQMEIATQQLSKRIKRISIEEFMKVTSMSPRPCPNLIPPTPPPLPQLSPPLILQRTPNNHRCPKNSSIKKTPNVPKKSPCHQNATDVPTRQQDKATERSIENTDYSSLPARKQSGTKHQSNCSDSRMRNMEEFNRRLVSSDNWKKALISGVDPKELYFTHHGPDNGTQDIKNILSECGILEHSKKRNKRGTKNRKVHLSKEDFLQNRNFSSNRSYSPEVLDRMRKALESAGEWDWDRNQPNRNQHQGKSLKKNRKDREEIRGRGHGSNQQSQETQAEEDSYFTTTSANSSEPLFEKRTNHKVAGKGVYRSFDGPISSHSDSIFSNNLEMNNSRQQTPSSEKVISKHNLPSESDERDDLLSAAVLMGKYTQKKQFPLDDMTYNQGSRRILQYLHGLWLEQTTCDVTIMANGGSILAHKLVLAAWSQTLASLFKQHSSNLDQSQEDPATINMIEYPRDVVADVVNFLYTTDIKLELTNIGVVVAVSRELDITTLVNVCGDFLIKTCEPESILLYYSVAANNELKFAQEGLEGVIASSITEVADHKYFLNLPYQRIRSILSNASLCGREIDIFQAVVRWVDFNRKERQPKASSLLKMIRFQHMCMNDLAQKVEFASWIFQDKEPRDLLLAAYKFHAMLSSGVTPPGNFRLDKPRCASYNKKKPLVASLNDFRKDYKNKMKACLVNQGAFQTDSWEKEELSKHSKVSEENAGKDWKKAEEAEKDIPVDALETSKKETEVDQKIASEPEDVEKSHLPVEEPNDSPLKNQSFSNNADVPDTPQNRENQRGFTSLEANLRSLKETFSSNKSSRKSRLCGEFQF